MTKILASTRTYLIWTIKDRATAKELRCDPLPVGEAAMRSLTFTLPAGDYVMTLVINGQAPLTLGNVIIKECL